VCSGRGLCVGLVALAEKSLAGRNREAWKMRRPWHTGADVQWERKCQVNYVCMKSQCRSENDFSCCVELVFTLGSKRALV
jgi:hypothetical protein